MAIDEEREFIPADVPLDPHAECLRLALAATIMIREAKAIAERLPNHGNLYFELEDASAILCQSLTRLMEGRPDDPVDVGRALVYDYPPA